MKTNDIDYRIQGKNIRTQIERILSDSPVVLIMQISYYNMEMSIHWTLLNIYIYMYLLFELNKLSVLRILWLVKFIVVLLLVYSL